MKRVCTKVVVVWHFAWRGAYGMRARVENELAAYSKVDGGGTMDFHFTAARSRDAIQRQTELARVANSCLCAPAG
jgi:hypothetical protein